MPQISEIWKMRVYYKGRVGRNKSRPVLIVNYEDSNGLYTVQEITSIPPEIPPKFYDQFKMPLRKWMEYGLDESSYVKCATTNTHKVEQIRLHEKIGEMDEETFILTIEKILEAKIILNR